MSCKMLQKGRLCDDIVNLGAEKTAKAINLQKKQNILILCKEIK